MAWENGQILQLITFFFFFALILLFHVPVFIRFETQGKVI